MPTFYYQKSNKSITNLNVIFGWKHLATHTIEMCLTNAKNYNQIQQNIFYVTYGVNCIVMLLIYIDNVKLPMNLIYQLIAINELRRRWSIKNALKTTKKNHVFLENYNFSIVKFLIMVNMANMMKCIIVEWNMYAIIIIDHLKT